MWKADWKWHLVVVVQLLLFLHGVEMQQQQQATQRYQQQQREIGSEQKPQIYWATSINSKNNNNKRFQQANEWDAVAQKNYLDRQWGVSAPAPAPNPPPTSVPYSPPTPPAATAPPAPVYAPPPAPVYAPPPAPVYAPPPAPVYAPAPTSPPYQPYPPAYPEPSYPDPAPPAYPDPAPPAYPDPAPPAYNPAPPPAYAPPSYGPPPPAGPYYYYPPAKETKEKGPSIKDMLDMDKEAFATILPDHKKNLTNEQKIWLSVLTPLIIIALVVPLTAILLSSFTITTNGRKFGELNINTMKKSLRDIMESYGSVLETDECMQRIICDLGSYATVVPGNSVIHRVSFFFRFLSTLVPDTMKNNMAIFQKAVTYGAEKAQCDSFKCSLWKY